MKARISNHTTIHKWFDFDTDHLQMKVDYDDVNHAEVDAAIQQVKEIVDKYWDDDKHSSYYRQELLAIWDANEYDLQNNHENLTEYLRRYGVNNVESVEVKDLKGGDKVIVYFPEGKQQLRQIGIVDTISVEDNTFVIFEEDSVVDNKKLRLFNVFNRIERFKQ